MSNQLITIYTENIIYREVKEKQSNSEYNELSVGGTKMTELRYADDTAIFSTTHEAFDKTVQVVNQQSFSPFCRYLGRVDVLNHFDQLSLSGAQSGRILFCFMSCFKRYIHLSLGLPLGRDPSI